MCRTSTHYPWGLPANSDIYANIATGFSLGQKGPGAAAAGRDGIG